MSYTAVDVDEVMKETAGAFLLRLESGDERWVPKSLIDNQIEVGECEIAVDIATWFVRKEME